jgi:MraZ protein
MLLGTWTQTVDAQGRLQLPASFREDLEPNFVATRGFESCLQAFPNDAWSALSRRISALPLSAADARLLRRLIFSAAQILAPDDATTVQLSQALRDYAGIRDQVVIVGMQTHFEIWSAERWRNETDKLQQNADRWNALDLSMAA